MSWIDEIINASLPSEDEIGQAIDALHFKADEVDRIRSISAFKMVHLDE